MEPAVMADKTAVYLSLVDHRIHAQIPYAGGDGPRRAKTVPGARWSKSASRWTYPLNLEVCRLLRETWGDALRIGPELWAWAAEQNAQRADLHSARDYAAVQLQHLPEIAPTLAAALDNRPYQISAAAFAARGANVLLADEPGLGKTLQAMAAVVESNPTGGRFLVIAPRTSIGIVWQPELKRWIGDVAGGLRVWAAREGRAVRERMLGEACHAGASTSQNAAFEFTVINPEMVRVRTDVHGKVPDYPALFSVVWDAVIADETHKTLIRTRGSNTLVREGMMSLVARQRIALTGTPFKGKTKNFWGTLNWLRPTEYTSFWNWATMYLTVDDNGWGKDVGELIPARREAFYRDLDGVMLRRTKNELRALNPAWAPPPKQYQDVWCDMGRVQKKAYGDMRDEAVVRLGDEQLVANGVLAELTRLKQFATAHGRLDEQKRFVPTLPSAKFDRLLMMLEERGITGDPDESGGTSKIVVGSQFTQIINLFAGELRARGIDCHVLTGETSARARTAAVAEFQAAGGPRVFLLNTTAGGVSITLDAADELVVLDETWVPDDQEQLEDRVHRTSDVTHSVTIYYFRTRGTIESDIANRVGAADRMQKKHLDGRRGVAYGRELGQQGGSK